MTHRNRNATWSTPMKAMVSPDLLAEPLTLSTIKRRVRRSGGRLRVPVSIVSGLAAVGAVIALWAPTYLGVRNDLGIPAWPEVFEWSLVVVGALGLGGVVYLAWQDTRDPTWRASHGFLRRIRSNSAGH
jgi:hypothetical protein